MNESDYLRQQMATERAHLREALAPPGVLLPRAVGSYLAWATPRLLAVLGRHLALLPDRLAATAASLPQVTVRIDSNVQAVTAPLAALQAALGNPRDIVVHDEDDGPLRQALAALSPSLTTLLDLCDRDLEALAAGCYRIEDWRRVSQLDADGILKERRLFTGMRA